MLSSFLSGEIFMACWVIALFFLKSWKRLHDPLFAFFAFAFLLFGIERLALIFMPRQDEVHAGVYLFRLAGFVLILAGVIQKNRRRN